MLKRCGGTLVELLVAMTLTAVLLGAASGALIRQRRDGDGAASRSRAESQVRAALAEATSALQGLSPSAGDLSAGEARDTALQLRILVAQGIACDSASGQAILSVADTSVERESTVATAPRAGDTLWWWPPGGVSWIARRVTSVVSLNGACTRAGVINGALLRLGISNGDTVPRAAPLRLTRQARYSIYRAGDGSWQLGIAEWSEVLHDFAAPQPVAGPFLLVGPTGTRSGFRYFDAAGAELPSAGQGPPVGSVARVRVTFVSAETGSGASSPPLQDSMDVALAHAP